MTDLIEIYFSPADWDDARDVRLWESGNEPLADNRYSSARGSWQHMGYMWEDRCAGWFGTGPGTAPNILDDAINHETGARLAYDSGGWSHWEAVYDYGLDEYKIRGGKDWSQQIPDSSWVVPAVVIDPDSLGTVSPFWRPLRPDTISNGDRDWKQDLRVSTVQGALGTTSVDGVFGQGTDAAVREFQTYAGLDDDGVVGPATAACLGIDDWQPIPATWPPPSSGDPADPGSVEERLAAVEAQAAAADQRSVTNRRTIETYHPGSFG